ncbi:hypothetical protein WJX84_012196 [Apatococcus fuscideae]|uniref:AMP-binding enzyme C-terminal domain-containing protein n=1 Tax=Apatococcus fuscideae TaxID=2026836 RepID=A0AAW1TGT4_9CHLO
MVSMFQNLLKSIARMPETSIWKLPLVTLEERRQLQKFEVTAPVAAQLPDEMRLEPGHTAWPLCLDGNQQQLPLGVRGELFLGTGPRSMDLTAVGPLQSTGLLVRFMPDFSIQVIGQLDNKIAINAYPVQLEELEALVVSASLQVQEAAVMVHPDEKSGKECLVAFVSPPNVDMQALDLTFRKKYPLYMVPALFHGVERIPRLRNGQVFRGALPQPDWKKRREVPYTAPRSTLEIEVLGVTLPALGIFRERTIANLAVTIRKARVEQKNGVAKLSKGGRQPSFKRVGSKRQPLPPAPAPNARWAPSRSTTRETELASTRPGRLVLPGETTGLPRRESNVSSGAVTPESTSQASQVGLLSNER